VPWERTVASTKVPPSIAGKARRDLRLGRLSASASVICEGSKKLVYQILGTRRVWESGSPGLGARASIT
jgi:hypothetical protein